MNFFLDSASSTSSQRLALYNSRRQMRMMEKWAKRKLELLARECPIVAETIAIAKREELRAYFAPLFSAIEIMPTYEVDLSDLETVTIAFGDRITVNEAERLTALDINLDDLEQEVPLAA